MAVTFIRIDDRLVHGQVVEGWIPFLGIDDVLVVSDAAAQDDMRKTLMRLSLPEEISLSVLSVAAAAPVMAAAAAARTKTLVLAASPLEVEQLLEKGVKMESVNVGGMHYSVGKMQIGRAVFLSEADIASLKKISAAGVKLEGRGVPTDKASDVIAMMHV